jgi:glucosamine-6-phosphate deaminase
MGSTDTGTDIEVVADARAAGVRVAGEVVAALGGKPGRRFVLGLPAGRTPRTTVDALAAAAAGGTDLSGLEIVMMDEFVLPEATGFRPVDPTAPHSCRRFGEVEVRRRLGAGALHVPDPADPAAYDELVAGLGGVDLFVLASGASDGHVGFNQPGSAVTSGTRVVGLGDELRRDNLGTFPSFGTLDAVPHHGITIGLGTIVDASKRAVLLLLGAEKARSAQRVTWRRHFDESWPATVIHECEGARIVADRAAVAVGER